jgi:hypothetical protein
LRSYTAAFICCLRHAVGIQAVGFKVVIGMAVAIKTVMARRGADKKQKR